MSAITYTSNDWLDSFKNSELIITDLHHLQWESDMMHIQRLFFPNETLSSCSYLNLFTGRVDVHLGSYKDEIMGFDQLANMLTLENLLAATPEDELTNIMEKEIRYLDFIMKLPPESKSTFLLQYYRPLLNREGVCGMFRLKVTVFMQDANGRPWILKIQARYLPDVEYRVEDAEQVLCQRSKCYDEEVYKFEERMLTKLEKQVIWYRGSHYSEDVAAGKLVISPKTVKTHCRNAMNKLGTHNLKTAYRMLFE